MSNYHYKCNQQEAEEIMEMARKKGLVLHPNSTGYIHKTGDWRVVAIGWCNNSVAYLYSMYIIGESISRSEFLSRLGLSTTTALRPGDTVERISGKQGGMRSGDTGTVVSVGKTTVELEEWDGRHLISALKPVSGSQDIRVGDTVERTSGTQGGMEEGDTGVVTAVHATTVELDDWDGYHLKSKLKKTKGATPVSGTKTQRKDEQVYRSAESEGDGCGKGETIRAGRCKGIVADAGELVATTLRPRTGKGRVGHVEVRFQAVHASHL